MLNHIQRHLKELCVIRRNCKGTLQVKQGIEVANKWQEERLEYKHIIRLETYIEKELERQTHKSELQDEQPIT